MSAPPEAWTSSEQREGGCRRPCCRAGLQAGAEAWEGFAQPLPIPASAAAVGGGSRAPCPGLAGVAAGVSPVASGRSCQSGQAETPPHANVAPQRAYATLDRASATWATLHHLLEAAPTSSVSSPDPKRPPGWGPHERPTDPVAQILLCASLRGVFLIRRNQ